jgi:hypothetical protein
MTTAMEFVDSYGRKWDLKLNMLIANRIERSDYKSIGVDKPIEILNLSDDLLRDIITKPKLMFAIIWTIVQDQVKEKYAAWQALSDAEKKTAKAKKLDVWPVPPENEEESQNEFISGIDGKTIDAARNALIESLADFFQEMKSVLYELKNQIELVRELLEKRTPKLREKMREEMEKELDKFLQT